MFFLERAQEYFTVGIITKRRNFEFEVPIPNITTSPDKEAHSVSTSIEVGPRCNTSGLEGTCDAVSTSIVQQDQSRRNGDSDMNPMPLSDEFSITKAIL
jgi:hypothetical protein